MPCARPTSLIAAVGLGAGTIAAWGETGDSMRFFEINPAAETYARQYFTFLSDGRAAVDVAIGDARLSLERALRDGSGGGAYDVLARIRDRLTAREP